MGFGKSILNVSNLRSFLLLPSYLKQVQYEGSAGVRKPVALERVGVGVKGAVAPPLSSRGGGKNYLLLPPTSRGSFHNYANAER